MFTWSLGWAPSPARLAITSLAFMFDEVPEPVWKTSIGNWSSCSPLATSSPARAIRSASVGVQQPQLGVHAGGGRLDPPQPVHHRRGHALAGHGEVLDRLARLGPPKLLLNRHVNGGYRAQVVQWPHAAGRAAAFRVLIDHVTALTRIEPSSPPPARPAGVGPLLLALRSRLERAPDRRVCDRCESGRAAQLPARGAARASAFLICTYELAGQRRERGRRGDLRAPRTASSGPTCSTWRPARSATSSWPATPRWPPSAPASPWCAAAAALGRGRGAGHAGRPGSPPAGPPRAALVTVQPTGFGRR